MTSQVRPKVWLATRMMMVKRWGVSITLLVTCPMALEGIAARKLFIAHVANKFFEPIMNFVNVLNQLMVVG